MLKKQLFYLGMTLITLFSALDAIQPVTDLSLVGGWRRDQIKTVIKAEAPKGDPFLADEFTLNRINIWEIGVRGQFAIPNLCHRRCYDWLTQFYFRGSAYWGWGDTGRANQNTRDLDSSYSSLHSSQYLPTSSDYDRGNLRAYAHGIHTQDYSVGFGWQYVINDNWGISPRVGYAWNKLSVHTRRCKRDDAYDPTREELHYSSDWRGPWVGYDLAYEGYDWRFNTGYEYHWARWHGAYTLPDRDVLPYCGGFSDIRHAKDKYGNVLYANWWYDFCYNWELGLGFKYTYFKSGTGSEKPKVGCFRRIGCIPTEYDRIKFARWISYEVTATLGYLF